MDRHRRARNPPTSIALRSSRALDVFNNTKTCSCTGQAESRRVAVLCESAACSMLSAYEQMMPVAWVCVQVCAWHPPSHVEAIDA